MKPVYVKSNTYIDFGKNNNKEDSKLKVGDNVRIQKCKNIFTKGNVGLKRFLWLKKLIILYRGLMLLTILMEKKFLKYFTKTNWKKQIKKSLELKQQ